MASVSITNISYRSATVVASANSEANNTRWWTVTVRSLLGGTDTHSILSKAQTIECDLSGLSPGTYYSVTVTYGPNGDDYTAGSTSFTTLEEVVYDHTLSFVCSVTATSVTATVILTSGAVSYDVDLTLYLDDARALECDIAAGSTSRSRTWTTSITPLTPYRVTLYDRLRDMRWYIDVFTKSNFYWSTTVASGAEFNLKASDWNEFVRQMKIKDDYWTGRVDRVWTDAVVGGNLTANMFNQAVTVINSLVSEGADDCVTTMSKVSKGDPVTAALINQLAACLRE